MLDRSAPATKGDIEDARTDLVARSDKLETRVDNLDIRMDKLESELKSVETRLVERMDKMVIELSGVVQRALEHDVAELKTHEGPPSPGRGRKSAR